MKIIDLVRIRTATPVIQPVASHYTNCVRDLILKHKQHYYFFGKMDDRSREMETYTHSMAKNHIPSREASQKHESCLCGMFACGKRGLIMSLSSIQAVLSNISEIQCVRVNFELEQTGRLNP
jgi:hypothetical protein